MVRSAEPTRTAIVDRAMAMASRTGLDGLSIGRLADDIGMSKGGLFAHFGSKEELEVQVLEAAAEKFVATVVRPALALPRGLPRLRGVFERWLDWHRRSDAEGGCIFFAAAAEFDDRPGPVRERLVALQQQWFETLAKAVRLAVEEGHFRKDVDPEQVAFELLGAAFAFHHTARLLLHASACERARRALESIIRSASRYSWGA